jgi:hypothetical protein
MAARKLSSHVVGYVGERLVEVYTIMSSSGKLTSFKPGVDVDHKDLIFDELGRNRNVYAQVKCALAVDPHGFVHFRASFADADIPSSARFVYILCRLNANQMALTHIWLVPSKDFNELAMRTKYQGRIVLLASPGVTKRSKWNPYRVTPDELGPKLLYLARHAPAEEPIDLPGALLLLAGR